MTYLQQPELLSPVGDWDSLYAAVQNGCDAIYLGGKDFNARQRADNFSTTDLAEIIDYAHLRGVKVYITLNTLHKEQEIPDLSFFIDQIYEFGADAVIVQDLGTAKLINSFFPDIELHASTQMNIHNLAGAELLEELGFERVILARELDLAQIREIKMGTELQIETFVHGALCISYSGQCLMSSLIGGRSGNRGRCAQPCRMPYTLIDRDSGEIIEEDFTKSHLLSPKDINTLAMIPRLVEAGIDSFKIEGRLKRPEYTALVTRLYRKYINKYFSKRDDYEVEESDQEDLAQLFNRSGFIPGYYKGKKDLDLISHQRPKNWGLKIGQVISYDSQTQECQLRLTKEVKQGDGIEIWTEQGDNIILTLSEIDYRADDIIAVRIEKEVKKGADVYKNSDQELLADLAKSYQKPNTLRNIEVYAKVTAQVGKYLRLELWDEAGYFVRTSLDFKVEEAKNQPVTGAEIEEQLARLGNTPYNLAQLNLEIDSNIFIPISKLNELRRQAVKKLNQTRLEGNQPKQRRNRYSSEKVKKKSNHKKIDEPRLTARVNNLEQLKVVLDKKIAQVYFPLREVDLAQFSRAAQNAVKTEIFIKLPRIAHQDELEKIKTKLAKIDKNLIDGYLISQLGAFELVTGTDKSLAADFSLNIFNSWTLERLAEFGVETAAVSPELRLKEIEDLATDKNIVKEVIVYGYLPMMVSNYCPVGGVARKFDFSQECTINCQNRNYGLRDRKGMVEAIKTDPQNCRSIIYNSQPLHLLNHLAKFKDSNCARLRLDFTFEGKEETAEIIKNYQTQLRNPQQKVSSTIKNYTTGHFFRGVK